MATAEKRFRTRRQWNNTSFILIVSPFLLLLALFYGVSTGRFVPLAVVVGFAIVLLVVAIMRDRIARCLYLVQGSTIVLERPGERFAIESESIIDASLVDRSAARDIIRQRSAARAASYAEQRELERRFVRFCTVDIGLRTYTFGVGRRFIDRMPNAKHDLVLLRIAGDADVLLSPEHNQDLVEHVWRLKRRAESGAQK
jgi:hypothetical protein